MAKSPAVTQGDPFLASASKARAVQSAAAGNSAAGWVGLPLGDCPFHGRSGEDFPVCAESAVCLRGAGLLAGLLAGLSVRDLQGVPLPAGPFPVSAVSVALCDRSSAVRRNFVPERDVTSPSRPLGGGWGSPPAVPAASLSMVPWIVPAHVLSLPRVVAVGLRRQGDAAPLRMVSAPGSSSARNWLPCCGQRVPYELVRVSWDPAG